MEERWMRLALQEAQLAADEGEIPVGAVIIRDGQVIARAHNRREAEHDPTAHAELLCMRQAAATLGDWRLRGCTLYVTLEPCPMCAGAISQARVLRLVYGAADEHYGCAGSVYRIPEDPAFNHFCPCNGGILEKECASLLHEFFEDRRT